MTTRYLSFMKISLPLLVTGLLVLLVVIPVLSAQVTLIDDGFERPTTFELWDANGSTIWTTSPSIFHSGARSARAAKNSDGLLTSDDLDTSDAKSVDVDFWFRKSGTSDTGFTLYYYDGSTYDLIDELDGLGADDTWLHYTETVTDPQYFISDFRIQFDATLGNSEFAYLDDVLITKDTGVTLEVTKSGAGSGTVTSDLAGINCGTDCTENYATDTVVTLTATSASGSLFAGWFGAGCSGTDPCVVTMNGAKTVDAEFIPGALLTISKDGTGSGTVTSSPAGIDCGTDCEETYIYDTVVTLTADADPGSTFDSWSGDSCSGNGTCIVTMNVATSVTATFSQDQYMLTTNVTGMGSVGKSPDQATYVYDDVVTLTATGDPGWAFAGWSGDVTSTENPLQVMILGNTSITAEFTQTNFPLYLPLISNNH